METLVRLLTVAAPVAWTAAAAAYLLVFVRQAQGAERWRPASRGSPSRAPLGAVLARTPRHLPDAAHGSVISGLGLSVGAVHLVLEGRAKDRAIGVFPIAAAMVFSIAGRRCRPPAPPRRQSPAGLHRAPRDGASSGTRACSSPHCSGSSTWCSASPQAQVVRPLWERLPSLELLDTFARRALFAGVVSSRSRSASAT